MPVALIWCQTCLGLRYWVWISISGFGSLFLGLGLCSCDPGHARPKFLSGIFFFLGIFGNGKMRDLRLKIFLVCKLSLRDSIFKCTVRGKNATSDVIRP